MNPQHSIPPADDAELRSMLSALMDGDADPAAVQQGCAQWRDEPSARATWHTYHLIGDVMRSDDLAGAPARDAAFLAALRERLADEPVVLAPAPVPRRPVWLLPTAVAAGFMAVAGALVVSRLSAPEPADAQVMASSTLGAPLEAGVQRVGTAPAAASQPLAMDGRLIRDAGLDAYLRAHRDMRGGTAAALPGGAMRSVETIAPQR
jgi:sigma-E factor negative regulatory protein RseA